MAAPTVRFPRETPEQESKHKKWLEEYNSRITEYSTCKLVDSLGNKGIHPEIAPFVQIHDELCGATKLKPLA